MNAPRPNYIPTWLQIGVEFIVALVILGLANSSTIVARLLGSDSILATSTEIRFKSGFLTSLNWLSQRGHSASITTLVFWMAVGIAVYCLVWLIIVLSTNIKEDVSFTQTFSDPNSLHRSSLAAAHVSATIFNFFVRLLAIVIAIILIAFFLPAGITFTKAAIASLPNGNGWVELLVGVSSTVMCLHMCWLSLQLIFPKLRSDRG